MALVPAVCESKDAGKKGKDWGPVVKNRENKFLA